MRLYDLGPDMARLQDLAEEGEDVSSALLALEGDVEQRLDAACMVLRDSSLDAAKLKEEIDRLTQKKRAVEANAERLRTYLRESMLAADIRKIRTSVFSISCSPDGNERVVVDDLDKIPDEYVRIRREPDKAKILEAYKQLGELVEGTSIERGSRLVIR